MVANVDNPRPPPAVTAAGGAFARWSGLLALLGDHRGPYLLAAAASAALGGVGGLLHPLLIRAIFDEAAARSDFPRFLMLTLCYLLLCLGTNAGAYACSLWQQRVDNRIVSQVSSDLLSAYYRSSYRDVLENGTGHYVARIRSDVKDGVVPLLSGVRALCTQTVTFMALVSALLLISWKAFAALVVIIPIATFVSLRVSGRIRELTLVEREREAELMTTLSKAVGAFKMVCGFGLVRQTVAAHDARLNQVLASAYGRFKVVRTLQGASDVTMVVSDACSIFVGALFVFRQEMTLGSFIAFMNAFWRSATTLIGIFKTWAEVQSYSATVDRIAGFLGTHAVPLTSGGSSLHAEGITFAYGGAPVFARFSMQLAAGERALIVGPNGAGKTTLANVLAGHLQPVAGTLRAPATVSAITLPLVFPPLRVGELELDDGLLLALGMSGPDIATCFPDDLSAGQQQKVALALALSRDADLYVLDEPTANLDKASACTAMDLIDSRTKGRMLILIMHGVRDESRFDQVVRVGMPAADPDAASRRHPDRAVAGAELQ